MRKHGLRFLMIMGLMGCITGRTLAVPAAVIRIGDPMTIDGDASDWAPVTVQQSIAGPDGEIATFKAAYDQNNLYVMVQAKDDSPLKNSTGASDPAMMLKGGDAIAICIGKMDGKGLNQRIMFAMLAGKPVVVTYRPQSTISKPYTFASPVSKVTLDYVDVLAGARAAFKPVTGGYVAEVSIPWRELELDPAAGIAFPFDVQVILSDPSGSTNAATYWWHSTGSGPLATVDLPTEAQLYPDAWGTAQLRLIAEPVGSAKIAYERSAAPGTAKAGTPVTFDLPVAAKVSLVIADAKGCAVRELLVAEKMAAGQQTVLWDGRDDYGDPLPPGEYGWRLAYFQPIGSKRIGGAGNSAKPPYRTPDGKGDLSAVHGLPVATASDAGGVYHLGGCEEGNPGFTKLNVNGECLWKHSLGGFGVGRATAADGKFAYMIVSANKKTDLVRMDAGTGRDAPIAGRSARITLGDEKLAVAGMAIVGDKAYYSVPAENRIGVVDLTAGASGKDLTVPNPSGICRLDDGHLLVCSESNVLSLDLANGKTAVLLSGLDAPRAVAVDSSGMIYVAEQGRTQQIAKFSSDGKLMARLGSAGGRPATCNPYDPSGVYQIGSLTIGPDGNVWFIEHSNLRRMGVMTTAGKWIKDIFQTIPSQGGAGVDLEDMSRVFYHSGYGSLVCQGKIDFATGAWNLEAIYNMTQTGDYAEPAPEDLAARSTADVFAAPIAFTGVNGIRYYWQEGGIASLWIMEKGRMVPLHVIAGKGRGDGTVLPKTKFISWSDANGDGNLQAAEVDLGDEGMAGARWIDRDLTLYDSAGSLKPYKIDARGVPYYHLGDRKPYITAGKGPEYYFRDGGYGIQVSPPTPDGGTYFSFNIGTGQGRAFWDRCTYSRLARAKDGKIQWIVGRHDGRKLHDGDVTYLWRPLGEVDGVVVVGDVDFQLLAYTSDGLALGWVTPLAKSGVKPETIVQENVQSSHFFRDPKSGKPLVVIGSGTEALVLEVTGIDPAGIKRLSGRVMLDSSQPRSVQTAGQYRLLYRTWPNVDNGRFYGVNGDDPDWMTDVPEMVIRDGKTLAADVRLRRDCGSLHVYATVLDPTPLPQVQGAGTLAALYGQADGVEVLIGPAQPADRKTAAPGDTRIFLTAVRDKGALRGVALACRPADVDDNLPSFNPGLVPIPGAKVAAREDLNGQGYRIEAEIPLSFLPELSRETSVTFIRNYWPGAKRKGDFLEKYTEVKPDLAGPARLNVAVLRADGSGGVQRLPWAPDAENTSDPRQMNPATWGQAMDQ